jgi:hypothetical protein
MARIDRRLSSTQTSLRAREQLGFKNGLFNKRPRGNTMESQSDYETKVNDQVDHWNTEIDELILESLEDKGFNPERDERATELIATREAVRRGLFRLDEQGDSCLVCAAEPREEVSPER